MFQRLINPALRVPLKYTLMFGIGGSAVILTAVNYTYKKVVEEVLETGPCADEARLKFYKNRTAKAILGVPITEGHVDVMDPRNWDDSYQCHINLPVQGTNRSGHIHFEGKKNLNTGDWFLTALSLRSEDLETTLYSIIPPEE